MRVRILGRFWNLVFSQMKDRGECDPPGRPGKEIRINTKLSGVERLEVLLHEVLHGASWEVFDETFVEKVAVDMSAILWKLGYRGPQDAP